MEQNRLSQYLHSLECEDITLINDIASYAAEHDIPIARRETVSFLQTVIKLARPKKVLEVGCCIGYSAIMMAEAMDEGHITTIEIGAADAAMARDNFARYDNDRVSIELIEADATDVLPQLTDSYDLIFMDAAKGQYINWLPQVKRLLKSGGVLISDNVLLDMTVFESRFSIERRDRTIHERMRRYLYELKHAQDLTTSILPVGDGVAFTVKD